MPGPSPKPDSERRNRTKPTFEWTLLPATGRKGPAPKLPAKTPDRNPWSATTKSWWSKLWHTPQATQWREDDDELYRLAWLRERFWLGQATGTDQNVMLAIEDRHGLNDKAMMNLRWRIVTEEQITQARERPAADVRRRLRVVG